MLSMACALLFGTLETIGKRDEEEPDLSEFPMLASFMPVTVPMATPFGAGDMSPNSLSGAKLGLSFSVDRHGEREDEVHKEEESVFFKYLSRRSACDGLLFGVLC